MKRIILTDIDHSISDATWRDPMIAANDWDAYHAASIIDEPISDTIALLVSLSIQQWLIVGVTARPGKWRKLTMDWMMRHRVPMDELLMRPDDNYRSSPEMKMELVTERFGPDFAEAITIMLEDREDVTKAFKAAGVTVLQVHSHNRRLVNGNR